MPKRKVTFSRDEHKKRLNSYVHPNRALQTLFFSFLGGTTCEINFRTNQLEPEVLKTYLPESYSSWVFLKMFMVFFKVLPEKVHVETFNFWF